jgi:Phosphodiester glycosidase/FlgD Ig-like domain
VLVRSGKAVFRSLEDFTNEQIAARDARAGVGQLADGRIVLVAVDGRQPGYSVGMTSFELAQTMQRLGAVTAAGLESGGAVTAAFDGQLLSRPADPTGERAVREALLVEYFGVYAPPLPVPLLNGDAARSVEPLTYKLVRPSTVTAALVGPDGVARVVENAVAHAPGSYSVPFPPLDAEGGWHWRVQATDDLGRTSIADRPFRYDVTLKGLAVPALSRGQLTVRFTLARPAKVRLRIETRTGITMRDLPPANLPAGPQQVVWDGRLPQGTRAYGGTYIAHVFVSSAVGTSDLSVPFAFRRSA